MTTITTVSWATATAGNWSAGTNWSTGTVPATGFDALVAATGAAYAITYDLTSPTVNSLTFSSANTVFKFSRNGNATLTVQNTLSLAAGTFSNSTSLAASTNALSAGSFAESGGTMTWQTGQFAVAGTVTIAGGTFQTNGNAGPNAPIVTAGALSLSGTGQFNMVNGTVTVTGLAQFNATTTQLITGLLTAGTIVVGATDTLDLNAASDTLTAGAGGLSVLGTLAGIGTIAGAISGTGTIQAVGANFIDPNVLEITGNIAAGVVLAIGTIANGSTVSSALQIDATAEALSALSMSSFLQTLKVAAAGTLTIDQTQTVSGSALIRLAGGTLADASGIVLGAIGSANVGTIEGYGTVAAAISNGAGTDPGGFVIANGGLLDLTGSIGANIALQVQSTVASTLKLDGTVVHLQRRRLADRCGDHQRQPDVGNRRLGAGHHQLGAERSRRCDPTGWRHADRHIGHRAGQRYGGRYDPRLRHHPDPHYDRRHRQRQRNRGDGRDPVADRFHRQRDHAGHRHRDRLHPADRQYG